MFDIHSISPLTLPSVFLEERSKLPDTSCIYFAINSQGAIQYIGRSVNLRQRWLAHHRYHQLEKMGDVKIAYLSVDSPELLYEIEKALIEWFQPPLNINYLNPRVYKYEKPFDWVHGEKKVGKQFMLTETASNAVDAIAKELGISRSEVVERATRCGGMQAAKKFNPETGDCQNGCT